MAAGCQAVMIEWIRRIDGAMSGDIAREVIASRSFFRESRGATVRSLVGSATGQESDIPDEFSVKYKCIAGKASLWLCPLMGTSGYQK